MTLTLGQTRGAGGKVFVGVPLFTIQYTTQLKAETNGIPSRMRIIAKTMLIGAGGLKASVTLFPTVFWAV